MSAPLLAPASRSGLASLRRLLVSLTLSVLSVALVLPGQVANAAGGPVSKVIVWGDSLSLGWAAYLEPMLGVPVIQKGVGSNDVQETEVLFNEWYNATPPAERNVTGHLCWCGHVNNNSAHQGGPKDIDTIVPTLQRMAAKVPGLFMPIGLTNGPLAYGPNSSVTPPSAASRDYLDTINDGTNSVTAVNEIMASPRPVGFGSSYAEVRRYLVTDGLRVAGIAPTATDQANIDVDVPPRSLRVDVDDPDTDAHLNEAGKRVTASRLNDLIRAAGWIAPSQNLRSTTSAASTANPSEAGQAIRLTASVRSASGTGTPTGRVQFYLNGVPFLEPVPVPLSGDVTSSSTTALPVGQPQIKAVYSGDATFATSSGSFTQVVTATGSVGTPPTVMGTVPPADATARAIGTNVTATFSESVTGVSGTSFRLTSPVGSVITATVTYSTTSFIATLNPASNLTADTRYTATLTGGSSAIRDADGNPIATTSWTFLTGPAPKVTATTPADGATGVSRTANITATFNEPVNGVSATTFTLTNSVTGAMITAVISRSGTTNKWILNPSGTLAANTRYTITLTGGPAAIRDLAGNPLSSFTRSFTTGA